MDVFLIAMTIFLSQFLGQTADKTGSASRGEFSANAEFKIAPSRARGQE
jgi:hypothetical protein